MSRSMKRLALALVVATLGGACTLILNTQDIIKACTSNAECDDGFECVENACLPVDEISEGEGEGDEDE